VYVVNVCFSVMSEFSISMMTINYMRRHYFECMFMPCVPVL